MPPYLAKAIFVFLGLLLLRQLTVLLPFAAHPVPRFLLNAVMGLAAFFMCNTVGEPFGLHLGVNAVTLPVSAGLGVPGVALLWALEYLM